MDALFKNKTLLYEQFSWGHRNIRFNWHYMAQAKTGNSLRIIPALKG